MTTREALADVILPSGLFIPQGTVCWIDIHGIQRDPDYWQQPEAFQPERFLDKVGCLGKIVPALSAAPKVSGQTTCLTVFIPD
jgi:cytochrome P450